jgi:signal transduction histidine kinase
MVLSDSRRGSGVSAWDPASHEGSPAAGVRLPEKLAHDLGNYLTAISGLAQVGRLMSAAEAKDSYLTRIEAAAMDMSQMVRSSLASLRTDPREPTDGDVLCGLVQSAVDLMRPRFEVKGVELRLAKGRRLPACPVAHVALKQAIVNLLDNALRATSRGGAVSVLVAASPRQSGICIKVQDTGVGIPKQDLGRVFMPGYTTRGDGCGIGLTVAREIVEFLHGGKLTLRSQPESGTTAFVYLPC